MNDDEVAINCGRCGRLLVLRLDYLRDKHILHLTGASSTHH
jgi:hypothetical protein